MSKLSTAFVLVDVPAHGLKAGQLVNAADGLIKALAKDGSVDPHKDAIAGARERGAAEQRSSIELAAEQRAQQREALLADIAKGEAALKDAKDDEVKSALEKDIAAQREALAAIAAD